MIGRDIRLAMTLPEKSPGFELPSNRQANPGKLPMMPFARLAIPDHGNERDRCGSAPPDLSAFARAEKRRRLVEGQLLFQKDKQKNRSRVVTVM
jgi:hypothetical protein